MANVRKDRVQVEIEINGSKVGKTIADLQKQYRDANRELRQLPIGTQEFIDKQKEVAGLKKVFDDQRKAVSEYAKALDEVQPRSIISLTNRVGELRRELNTLDPATAEFIDKSKELNQVEKELADITQEASNIKHSLEDIEPDSLQALERQATKLKDELKKLSPASDEFKRKAGELKQVEQQMEGIGIAAKTAGKVSIFSAAGIQKAFKSVDVALRATIIGFLAGLATSFLSSAQAAIEATGAMQGLREELNRLTGETGEDLDIIAAKTQATADAFSVDLKDAIQATNAAANAFGQDYVDTLGLIQEGLIATGSKGQEFLEQVREYGPQLRQAGLSAEQSFALIADSINKGIFNDKAADAIKEFDLRIKDLSKGQREVLEQTLGRDFTQRIVTGIETGKTSSIDALSEISGQLGELGADSADTQKVISNLFGGPGEDAGADFIISLQNVKGGLGDLIDETNIYTQRQREQLALEEEASKALADLSFQLDGTSAFWKKAGTAIKAGFLQALVGTVSYFQLLPTKFEIVGVQVLQGINYLAEKGSELLNTFLDPVRQLAELAGIKIDIPKITLPTFEIDKTPEQLQAELFQRLADQKKQFAEKQKQEALASQNGQADAERLNALRLQREKDLQTSSAIAKQAAEFEKAKKAATEKIQDLEAQLLQDATDRRVKLAELASEREIAALKGTEEQITLQKKLLIQKRDQEIEQIRKEGEAEAEEAEKTAFHKRLDTLNAYQEKKQLEITSAVLAEAEAGTLKEDIEDELQARLLAQYLEYLQGKADLEQEFGVDSTATAAEVEAAKLQAVKDRIAEEIQAEKDKADLLDDEKKKLIENIEGTLSNLQTINANILAQQVDTLKSQKDKELAIAGDNAEKRKKIDEKYQAEQAKLEEQAAKRRRLIAIAQKAIAIRETIINTAQSISASAKLGFPLAIPFIIAAGALGATQIGVIASQKFEKGGELPVTSAGGVTQGPRHRDAGIKLLDSKSGKIVGEVEGGEPILSRSTYENNRELVDRLLYSSQRLGGARIYEQGGILSAPSTTPSRETIERVESFDDSRMLERMDRLYTAIKQIRLKIGERESVAIGEQYDGYRSRTNGTGF